MKIGNENDESAGPHAWNTLFERVRSSFQEALRRSLGAAGQTEDGNPKRVPQQVFAANTGIARSTIAKYLGAPESVNPDLETICRIAHALRIPPAFLLLTSDDWERLADASAMLAMAAKSGDADQLLRKFTEDKGLLNPAQQAQAGFEIAQKIGVAPVKYNMPSQSTADIKLSDSRDEMNERMRRSLLTTCALPPLPAMRPEAGGILLYLCAIIGASQK